MRFFYFLVLDAYFLKNMDYKYLMYPHLANIIPCFFYGRAARIGKKGIAFDKLIGQNIHFFNDDYRNNNVVYAYGCWSAIF